MTILVAYVPRPEGRAALDKGIEIATRRNERLVVINAGPGGRQDDPSIVNGYEVERVEERLTALPITAEFRQFVRGKSAIDEVPNHPIGGGQRAGEGLGIFGHDGMVPNGT